VTERETLKAIREGILSGKCSDGDLAWIVNLCDESLAESGSANAGNAAAMYKALCEIVMLTMKVGYSIHGDVACGIIASKAKQALSEPPRQCEVGTSEEQVRRFSAFCDLSKSCRSCPVYKPNFTAIECFAQWAQSPYGESNGVK
jgi:hypothetical protein